MRWNWQLANWPNFYYDPEPIRALEKQFLLEVGGAAAFLKNIRQEDLAHFVVEILSQEGAENSKIEGELLDRASLQSSIKKHFGLQSSRKKDGKKEAGMAEVLCDVYKSYQEPLSHETLWGWHSLLFKENSRIEALGRYRAHAEPMQVVSHRYDRPLVYFEAPPSKQVFREMADFIHWFNASTSDPLLGRAAIAHVYFESIHPFEDGNGRIGRILVEKMLSQAVGRPILIALSKVLEKRKKAYYAVLGSCNRALQADAWVNFFAHATLEAMQDAMRWLLFLMEKAKRLTVLSGKLNPRQEKTVVRMFEAGPSGFLRGLSAENYIAITKTSRATATRDLSELVALGVLYRRGELRHTRYFLNIAS